jgi:hypothetical protein
MFSTSIFTGVVTSTLPTTSDAMQPGRNFDLPQPPTPCKKR